MLKTRYNGSMKVFKIILFLSLLPGCSFFGIQTEETPKYKVLVKNERFEIRKYAPYVVAKTSVKGDYKSSSSKAFRILAGYIFGKNKTKEQISMTSPVEMKSEKIAMTAPVQMSEQNDMMTMAFSMPSKYKLEGLPTPDDNRITFERVPAKIVASIQFSGLRSDKKIMNKEKELRQWLEKYPQYQVTQEISYAGYNPPWTIPIFRRNEVHIKLNPIATSID